MRCSLSWKRVLNTWISWVWGRSTTDGEQEIERLYLPLASDDELLQTVRRQFDRLHRLVRLRQPLVLQTRFGRQTLPKNAINK